MNTLKDARKGDLEAFVKEHEADPDGDLDKLDEAIKTSFQESGKEAANASSQNASDE